MPPGVVVFAAGNRSRGDDALGPLLLERLGHWLADAGRGAEFDLIEDYQLQIEHALDLQGRRLALFIDAGWRTAAPLAFYALLPIAAEASTHALSAQAVLGVYRRITGTAPPPSYMLCVRGEHFELGAGLSAAANANAERAWQLLEQLCTRADAAHWQAIVAEDPD